MMRSGLGHQRRQRFAQFVNVAVDRVGEDIVARGILRYWQGGTD